MPNTINNPATDDSSSNTSSAESKGTESNSQKTTQTTPQFDVSQIGDDDFNKVFDDPRLFNHPRFKQLSDRAKKAKELEKLQAEREEKELEEQGKIKELNEKLKAERDAAIERTNQVLLEAKVTQEALKQGAVDTEAVLKLMDMSNLKPDDNGNIEGLEDAVSALLEAKSYLKGEGQHRAIGSATNPGSDTGAAPRRFKHSQIKDTVFFKDNEAAILEAMRLGQIEDDL